MSINGAPVAAVTVVAVDVGKNRAALSATAADPAPFARPGRVRDDRAGPGRGAGADLCCAAGCCGEGGDRGGRALSPTAAGGFGVAGGLAGVGAESGSGGRAASGAGPAAGEDRRDRFGGDHRTGVAGHGVPVTARAAAVTELTGWAAHRSRRVLTRTATKNQLLAQLDRCFPGVGMTSRFGPSVLV